MTLKQQIEATIQAYEEACKPENLNWEYCYNNDIESGLCLYSWHKNYFELIKQLRKDFKSNFICTTPTGLNNLQSGITFTFYYKKCNTLLQAHQTRLQYLRNLLNTLSHENN